MINKYLDFELKVDVQGGQMEIDIDGRPHGISLPERLKISLPFAPISYNSLTQNPTNIANAGYTLFKSVFCEEVNTAFASYLNRRKDFEGVRVCIQTPSNALSEAIWEILCNQTSPTANFLALDPKTPIIRTPRTSWQIYDRDLQVPLRMLIVLASPRLQQKITPEEEKASLESALKEAVEQRFIVVDFLGFDEPKEANFDTLQEHLAKQTLPYDIVHIIGHSILESGMEGQIGFVKPDDGKMQSVPASSLANVFRSRGVLLVVLQSCQSGAVDSSATFYSGLAQQLVASGVPAVLAMQEIIDQDVAQDFIGKLYKQWISSHLPFEDALTQARQSVFQKYPERVASWAIPVLYIVPGFQLILKPPDTRQTPQPQQVLSTETTERQVDAALPKQIRLGRETTLLVLIRTPTAAGLRERLGALPREYDATPEDVLVSPTFDVSFAQDEKTGKSLPSVVKIVIETKDFELEHAEERVQIRPQGDSVLCHFLLTPKKEGAVRLLLKVLDNSEQGVTLTQLPLKSEVMTGDKFETEYKVVDSAQVTDERATQPSRHGESHDIALVAHLMRRAGFGASREELEVCAAKGYNATVEELLHPEVNEPGPGGQRLMRSDDWTFHMVNTKRPLQEKMALFWHHMFATENSGVDNQDQLLEQIEFFRERGMGNYRELLIALAHNPAMLYRLNDHEARERTMNENWGRELLELFSMGQGNYTEKDVREVSRAFTGWSITPKNPRLPYERFPWEFQYNPENHDDTEKTFLGYTGNFSDEDIIDIIVQQPACHTFICRHLYNFFVADEPQVQSWMVEPPGDPQAIAAMTKAFRESGFDMRAVLRTMFTADFFKNARFNKIKSSVELVVSTLRLVGGEEIPRLSSGKEIAIQPTYMGQDLLNPPSVEGWHTGKEWIDSGSLMKRINFVAEMVGDVSRPGVRFIINRIKAGGTLQPEQLVDAALDLMGPLEVSDATRQELLTYVREGGNLHWDNVQEAEQRVAELLQMIGATQEYQFK